MLSVWRWESTDSKADGELVDIDFGADSSIVSCLVGMSGKKWRLALTRTLYGVAGYHHHDYHQHLPPGLSLERVERGY